uniref:6-phosphogluconolactonase n=1 Tax=Alexandrium monilatum TaxID=311494 RepID=A0A7S4VAR3_9DINO|mmetsp:Transcript_50552/g.158223  ORF Transcript_50552/g.158223 Transcript_50552/m.158223 type:complete len:393 (-) Transcript_50552:8-1186(-)
MVPEGKRARIDEPQGSFVYVGSSTAGQAAVKDSPGFGKVTRKEERQGVCIFRTGLDGTLEPAGFFALGSHCGWLAPHPSNGHLYGVGGGKVHALKVTADGALTSASSADSIGNCHYLEISRDGRWVLVVSYSGGTVAVLPIHADGHLGEATDSKLHGMTPKPALADRQEACHPHQIRLDPQTGRWALVCDLGADCVWVYAFDPGRGALVGAANSRRHLVLPEGAGPRHLDFHPQKPWVYVLCELDGNVVVCDWDDKEGRLSPKQSIYVMAAGAACSRAHHSGTAHILVSADGHTVYASSRTDNQIVVFQVDTTTGMLSKIQSVPSGGICPRNFHLDYSSEQPRMRITNQDSQNLVVYAINSSDGTLREPPVSILELDGVCPQVIAGPVVARS